MLAQVNVKVCMHMQYNVNSAPLTLQVCKQQQIPLGSTNIPITGFYQH